MWMSNTLYQSVRAGGGSGETLIHLFEQTGHNIVTGCVKMLVSMISMMVVGRKKQNKP